jgi:hypothetical protein
MSTLGSYRYFISEVTDLIAEYGDEASDAVLRTGAARIAAAAHGGQVVLSEVA